MSNVSGRRIVTTAAPGNFVANLLTGQIYENVPYDAMVELALLQATAAAAPATGLIAQVACDGDIVLQDVNEVNLVIKATAPIYPDDYAMSFSCVAGSRLYLQVRNNSVGDIVCFYAVKLTPV